MCTIGTYLLTDVKTGKFYVGSSGDIQKRLDRHYRDLNCNEHHCPGLQELWWSNKRLRETIFRTETREEAYALEQDILDRYKDSDLLLNIGLSVKGGDNLTRNPRRDKIIELIKLKAKAFMSCLTKQEKIQLFGRAGSKNGMWGKTHTQDVRNRISEAQRSRVHQSGYQLNLTDEQRAELSERAKLRIGELNPFHGKRHSDETKKRISEAKKAQGLLPPNTRKVEVDGQVFESLTEAGRQLGLSPALMLYRLQSDKEKYSGYRYLNA